MPGRVIDRANRSRWQEEGGASLGERAHREVQRLLARTAAGLSDDVRAELTKRMHHEAGRHGMAKLPSTPHGPGPDLLA